ncbi:MAG: hypothetical protein OXN88_14395 [Chloroflexota bacterium]|nr:hypothetical protein [Chloroflexota bacterium]
MTAGAHRLAAQVGGFENGEQLKAKGARRFGENHSDKSRARRLLD